MPTVDTADVEHEDGHHPTPADPNPTRVLAGHAMALELGAVPDPTRTVAKQCALDVLGVALAGAAEPVTQAVRAVIAEDSPAGPATVVGSGWGSNSWGAALANGTAAHALDYDDVVVSMGAHPSAPVFPAVFALGEVLGASGADLLAAFLAGFETECRVGTAIGDSHYERGFHTTATVGTFGATAGAAHLLRLSPEACETAFGIAATQAAGLKSMFGTMCKPFHAGKAAASGVLAGRLAAQAFTSAEDVLACAQGFAATQSSSFDPEPLSTDFGEPWHVLATLFKLHAACYLTHASIEAVLDLQREQGLQASQVEDVEITVSPGHLSVCNIAEPRTGLEGKFSLRFTTALALARGRTDEDQFSDTAVIDPDLVALRDRVRVIPDNHIPRYAGRVVVRTRSGEVLQSEADMGKPRWQVDPSEQTDALVGKFHRLVDPLLGRGRAGKVAATVLALEDLPDVRVLGSLIRPAANELRR